MHRKDLGSHSDIVRRYLQCTFIEKILYRRMLYCNMVSTVRCGENLKKTLKASFSFILCLEGRYSTFILIPGLATVSVAVHSSSAEVGGDGEVGGGGMEGEGSN